MNRDFEFKQLLRAYRSGIISEATFETEMASLENGASSGINGNTGGFRAFGKSYKSEREAIISFIDKARVAESNAGVAFSKWAQVCKTECVRSGVRMIAERESYHGRIFEQRLHDLGAKPRAQVTEESRKFGECLADVGMSDNEKLLRFNALVPDPKKAVQPIHDFAAMIKDDLESKEMLRLFAEDELSSTTWLRDACAALNAPAESATMQAAADS